MYQTPGQDLNVGLTLPFNYAGGTQKLFRTDNFGMYFDQVSGQWKSYNSFGSPYANYNSYMGMFNAPPNAGAGSPGDHLIGSLSGLGAIELQFDRGIDGIMFRISTPTSGDVNATINAYAVANPTNLDTPIMTYRINATNAAGLCNSLAISFTTPVPCNVAPWIGVEGGNGQIRSVIVSSTDTATYIGDLYFQDFSDAPEPGTLVLLGSALALAAGWKRFSLPRR
jgi:hypothetical protein